MLIKCKNILKNKTTQYFVEKMFDTTRNIFFIEKYVTTHTTITVITALPLIYEFIYKNNIIYLQINRSTAISSFSFSSSRQLFPRLSSYQLPQSLRVDWFLLLLFCPSSSSSSSF